MTSADDALPAPPATGSATSAHEASNRGVVGNERLTALVGAPLLVLIVVELVTTARLRTLVSAHVFFGVFLVGPLLVKLGSTGYRFARYYTRALAYVRRGPPRLVLRALAPLLVATTVVLIGSGIGLVVVGPGQVGLMFRLHAVSALLWIPLLAIHAVAYFPRVPRLVADDWRTSTATSAKGRALRLGVNVGALLAGLIAALLLLPVAAPWNTRVQINGGQGVAAPLIVGLFIAVLALIATRPLRWR